MLHYDPQPAEPVKHDLYKKVDKGAPEQILDRNGDVVLDYCKRCGKAEIELSEPCIAEPVKVPSDAEILDELQSHSALATSNAVCAVRALLARYGKRPQPTKSQIREIFLANGFTIKPGEDDLKPYVYEAAYALQEWNS